MDFKKLKEMQKKSRDEKYLLSDDQAEEQIFDLISYYDIDLDFELDGLLEEDKNSEQKSDEEKQAGIGLKQILSDTGHFIKMGVIEIQSNENGLIIVQNLIKQVGEESEKSQPVKRVVYKSLTPKITMKMSNMDDKKFTFSRKAELLMSMLSDCGSAVFDNFWVADKKAARNIGILLMIAQ